MSDDERAQRRAEGIARLRAGAEADGLIEVGHDPEDPEATTTTFTLDLPHDDRDPWMICELCMRTMRKKGGRVELRPGVLVCPACASQPQPPELGQLEVWLAMSFEQRRALIALAYDIDPATMAVSRHETVEDRFYVDADGGPLAVESLRLPGRLVNMAMPRTYFAMVRERGRGIT